MSPLSAVTYHNTDRSVLSVLSSPSPSWPLLEHKHLHAFCNENLESSTAIETKYHFVTRV